ncbi:hypothetical protein LshimejAT787_1602790 [Lyophyllum shimeji]|uniref:Uncharacterized protein n=1 Tax=Lyophyllum shimeji TaxID=47721 RepID=A0A9P3UQU6_LYOSH|nr:hypothetical protein LshimejAT787_1602790 [Lyophyllum shimeji]
MSTATTSPSASGSRTRSSSGTPTTSSPSATTSGSLTSSTPGFPFSSTFSDPFPSQTSSSGGPGGGGGGGANNGGGGNINPGGGGIASSASLYLYTFLATLVLLLSVSAAIILRSLLLRRRHRRMMEEAIRNGTWIPPSPGGGPFGLGGRGGRVDLSRKPVMFESYIGGSEKDQMYGDAKHAAQTEWDWDSIRPFSATYITPPPASLPLPQGNNGTTTPAANGSAIQIPPPLTYTRRVIRFFRRGRAFTPQYPLTPRSNSASAVNLPTLPSGAGGADGGSTQPPAQVRVAVLIAMPHPPKEGVESKFKSPSPMPGPSSSSAAAVASSSLADEEEELPHLEFGVAELEVHDSDRGADAEGKDKGRASGSGSLDDPFATPARSDIAVKVVYDDEGTIFRRHLVDQVDSDLGATCAASFEATNAKDINPPKDLAAQAAKKDLCPSELEEIIDNANDRDREETSDNHGSAEERQMYDLLVRTALVELRSQLWRCHHTS